MMSVYTVSTNPAMEGEMARPPCGTPTWLTFRGERFDGPAVDLRRPDGLEGRDLGLDGREGFPGVEHVEGHLDLVGAARREGDDSPAGPLEGLRVGVVRRRFEA